MSLLTKEELKALSQRQDESLVSIYLQTRPVGPETRENPIRFKNLLAADNTFAKISEMRAVEYDTFFTD